jgi:hypothetical protein
MSSKVQRVPIAFSLGKGAHVPLTSGAANSLPVRPPAIQGAVEWQTLAVSQDTIQLSVPALGGLLTTDVTYNLTPAGLPASFTLAPGASGIVLVNFTTPSLPTGLGLVGISSSLTFAKGTPQDAGSSSWTLSARQQYQAARIQGAFRFLGLAAAPAQTLNVVMWTVLLCKPPTVG